MIYYQLRPVPVVVLLLTVVLVAGACGSDSATSDTGGSTSGPVGRVAPTFEEERQVAIDSPIGVVRVYGPGSVRVAGPGTHELEYEILRLGSDAGTYILEIIPGYNQTLVFVDASGFPRTVELQPDESIDVMIPITIPAGTPSGTTERFELVATAAGTTLPFDSVATRIEVR